MASLFSAAVLKIRDFRLLAQNKFLFTFGSQMVGVIVGWQIYQITHDPLSLGLIGLAEAIAFIAFALWAGHVADRSEKRFLIIGSETLALLCVVALLALTIAGVRATWPFYLTIGFSGMARAFLWSSSTSLSEMIVPREIYSSAAAWNSSAWEIASIIGPATGGILYGLRGPATAYAAATLVVAISLVFAFELNARHPVAELKEESVSKSLRTGIRFVFHHEVILTALALDMFAVLFGGVIAVLPVFAEILRVGPTGLGFLRASQSAGAITMALIQTRRPPFRHTGRTLLGAVSLFGLCMIAFGFSRNYYLSMALLALGGMADNLSVVIRASILQAATPNHMRGRVSAVNGIFIGSSNEIGAFESGLAAKLMGIVPSVAFGGMMTLLTVAVTWWRSPKLRALKTVQELGTEGFNVAIEKEL
jgi:predicted MFS family arabinose efflux permease